MLAVRCRQCGKDIRRNDDGKTGYHETWCATPCRACRSLPITPEEKLLRAIFGSR